MARQRVAQGGFAVLFLVAATALVWQFFQDLLGVWDDGGVEPPAGIRVWRFFSYFTTQSSMLVVATAFVLARQPDRDGRVWRVVRLDALAGITITGLVHWFLLHPLDHFVGAQWASDTLTHVVVPILAVAAWLVFGPRPRITLGTMFAALIWPLAWLGYTLVVGGLTRWYPYFFLDLTQTSGAVVTIYCLAILILLFVVSALFWLGDRLLPGVARRRRRRRRRRSPPRSTGPPESEMGRVPREFRGKPPAGQPSSVAPSLQPAPVPHAVEILQRSIGNRSVQRLLALQRDATPEQEKEFAGYKTGGDWGRAAWVLNEWQPPDIATRIKRLTPADLEALNEGAWFAGKNNVDAAIRALNPTAAALGALRVLIRHKRLDEAAKQLDVLEHKAAVRYVNALADKGTITGDELRLLMRTSPNLRLQVGETMFVGGSTYAVYATTVRAGGDVVWRYNNPGALKRPGTDIPGWGYIGSDPAGFLIFPDMATGQRAAFSNLQFQANKNGDRSILETMQAYASMPSDDPGAYADKIVKALGPPVTRATPFGRLTVPQLNIVKDTIFSTEVGKDGKELPYDSSELPQEVRERLRP